MATRQESMGNAILAYGYQTRALACGHKIASHMVLRRGERRRRGAHSSGKPRWTVGAPCTHAPIAAHSAPALACLCKG